MNLRGPTVASTQDTAFFETNYSTLAIWEACYPPEPITHRRSSSWPFHVKNVSAPGYGEDTLRKNRYARDVRCGRRFFFMVGFLTCLNDVISPHLKSIFALDYSQLQNVPFYFFSSYFVFSYPAGRIVEKFGYKKATVAGLLVMALGALGFLPAAQLASFPMFLAALVVLAGGMTIVQVAINPYVTVIGPPQTAASRLNLAQAFNSVGTFIAPLIGTWLILRDAKPPLTTDQLHTLSAIQQQLYRAEQASTVRVPYLIIALGLGLLALALALIKLKTQTGVSQYTQDFRPGAFAEALTAKRDSIWRHPWLICAAIGIFVYVGAEVSIGNLLVSYMGLSNIAALPAATAGYFLMVYWGGAMVGRFIGSAILQKVRTGWLLSLAAIGAFSLVVISLFTTGHVAMAALLAVGFCNSIMFPVHLHAWNSGPRPTHQQRFEPAHRLHPWWRDYPQAARHPRQSHRSAAQLYRAGHLLHLRRDLRHHGDPPSCRSQHTRQLIALAVAPGPHGVTGSETVTNPCVPVTAAIFTTCGSPGTSSGVTVTFPLPSEIAELRAEAITALAGHRPGAGHSPSHPSAV